MIFDRKLYLFTNNLVSDLKFGDDKSSRLNYKIFEEISLGII